MQQPVPPGRFPQQRDIRIKGKLSPDLLFIGSLGKHHRDEGRRIFLHKEGEQKQAMPGRIISRLGSDQLRERQQS